MNLMTRRMLHDQPTGRMSGCRSPVYRARSVSVFGTTRRFNSMSKFSSRSVARSLSEARGVAKGGSSCRSARYLPRTESESLVIIGWWP